MPKYNVEVIMKKRVRIDAENSIIAFKEAKFVADVIKEEYGDHLDVDYAVVEVKNPNATSELKLERVRLINKLEFGLFTTENDARKAQERLNHLNVIIDN